MWSGNAFGYDKSEMLMAGLCADIPLEDCSFSWYLTSEVDTSYLDFGKPNSSIVTDQNESAWIDIDKDDLWWSSTVSGFRWSPGTQWGKKDRNEYAFTPTKGLTDTGSSCLFGPEEDIISIFEPIIDSLDSAVIFECSRRSELPSFDLLFGGYWLRVNPEDYAISFPD